MRGETRDGDGILERNCVDLENYLQMFLMKAEGHIHFGIPRS